jgi:hypothetical protein
MTKAQLYRFTTNIYKRLKNESFNLRFMRVQGVHGFCWPGADVIQMNPQGQILSTLVHEMIHDIHPSWEEEKVLAHERVIMTQLSHRQMANLMVAMGKALLRSH